MPATNGREAGQAVEPSRTSKGRTMPVTSRSLPVGTAHQSSNIRSVAYIGSAGILAVFMLGFGSTPKASAQDNGHHLYHADYYSKWKQLGTDASRCNGKETKNGDVTGDCYPTTATAIGGLRRTTANGWSSPTTVSCATTIRTSSEPISASATAVCCVSSHRTRAHRRAMKSRRRADQPGALTAAKARRTGIVRPRDQAR